MGFASDLGPGRKPLNNLPQAEHYEPNGSADLISLCPVVVVLLKLSVEFGKGVV